MEFLSVLLAVVGLETPLGWWVLLQGPQRLHCRRVGHGQAGGSVDGSALGNHGHSRRRRPLAEGWNQAKRMSQIAERCEAQGLARLVRRCETTPAPGVEQLELCQLKKVSRVQFACTCDVFSDECCNWSEERLTHREPLSEDGTRNALGPLRASAAIGPRRTRRESLPDGLRLNATAIAQPKVEMLGCRSLF